MTVLHGYLIEGRDVYSFDESPDAVRGKLREVGIIVPPNAVRDPVADAVTRKGYRSLSEFVKEQGLTPITEQAEELGIHRHALTRSLDALRGLVASEHPSG